MDTEETEPRTRKVRPRRRAALGDHVAQVIARLQRGFLRDRPDAVAALAELRRAAREEPGATGAHEACWLPDDLLDIDPGATDEPSPAERALHTAVTLWALHQQSEHVRPMHVNGTGFAAAIHRLAAHSPNEATVHTAFAALGTSSTYRELSHHARRLVVQLRGADIGFDYGLLADDLRTFQDHRLHPVTGLTGPERVRSLWGREYWRAKPKPDDGAASDDKE